MSLEASLTSRGLQIPLSNVLMVVASFLFASTMFRINQNSSDLEGLIIMLFHISLFEKPIVQQIYVHEIISDHSFVANRDGDPLVLGMSSIFATLLDNVVSKGIYLSKSKDSYLFCKVIWVEI